MSPWQIVQAAATVRSRLGIQWWRRRTEHHGEGRESEPARAEQQWLIRGVGGAALLDGGGGRQPKNPSRVGFVGRPWVRGQGRREKGSACVISRYRGLGVEGHARAAGSHLSTMVRPR